MINSKPVSSYITSILAIACGVIVANLYYAQPLIATIGSAVNLPLALSGLTVTFTQIGYVFGLIFLVPLLDLVENRRLVLITLIIAGAWIRAFNTAFNPFKKSSKNVEAISTNTFINGSSSFITSLVAILKFATNIEFAFVF